MKISVIFTGGTIASVQENGVISPKAETGGALLKHFEYYNRRGVTFEAYYPYTALSENLCANYLNMLIDCVVKRAKAGDEKIIICHGSDTIQYSAAALSYAVLGKNICAVLVCSDKPLEAPDANGFENFEAAAEFLIQTDLNGVFASYKNKGEAPAILHGARLSSHPEGSDSLRDIFDLPVAVYDGGKINVNPSALSEIKTEKGGALCRQSSYPVFSETSGVLAVSAVPADSFSYDLNGIKAVILRPYHSGTLNTESEHLCDFCERAKKAQIPVFAVNVRSGAKYESSVLFEKLGIIALPFCAFPAMYIKAWLAGSNNCEMTEFMMKDAAGEFGGQC